MKLKFENIGIRAVAAAVPAKKIANAEALKNVVPADEIAKIVDAIGIKNRHIADEKTCASDLCEAAARELFSAQKIDPATIDVLIFASQTPDFRIPATAPSLQNRLNLPTTCAAFDFSLGCSAYVFALATAFSYVAAGANRVLLLCGETFSKIVNPRDRVNAPLYGDAGTATLVERGDFGNAIFSLNSDGSGANCVCVPAGGMRVPATPDSFAEKPDSDGSIRSDLQLFMNGFDVFNFALKRVPAAIRDVIDVPDSADWLVFHQANKMMTDFLAGRVRVPAEKLAYSLHEFGNVSAPSIPLTISAAIPPNSKRDSVILCGFGAGLSWGAAHLSLAGTQILPVKLV